MAGKIRTLYLAFKKSLMARLVIGITIPLLIIISLMSVMHYYQELNLFENQLQRTSIRMVDLLAGSLRHAMLTNDRRMINNVLKEVSKQELLSAIEIIDLNGRVQMAVHGSRAGQRRNKKKDGCVECHQFEPEVRPHLTYLRVSPQTVRVVSPIKNEPECAVCHGNTDTHLGVLLVDMSFSDINAHLRQDLGLEFILSLSSVFLVLFSMYLLLNRLLAKRMTDLREPLKRYAAGDFSARMPVTDGPPNILDQLSITFNNMAEQVEAHTKNQEARTALRERAIIEERERIARELHDGFAQLLGYVNTKAMAVRLMLQKDKPKLAEKHLFQLEEAARRMFIDVREAILGLRLTNGCCEDFFKQVQLFAEGYTRLNNLPVTFTVAPNVMLLPLTGETQLQLMRIIQETLANTRKHAEATHVWITFKRHRNQLVLSIKDNGIGFNPETQQIDRPHFGLSIIRERAQAVGATVTITSSPNKGTLIQVIWEGDSI